MTDGAVGGGGDGHGGGEGHWEQGNPTDRLSPGY